MFSQLVVRTSVSSGMVLDRNVETTVFRIAQGRSMVERSAEFGG
jgi:hypothetical protein